MIMKETFTQKCAKQFTSKVCTISSGTDSKIRFPNTMPAL